VQFHQGRLLDHVHVRVADLAASRRFYRAVLAAVGRELTREGENAFSVALNRIKKPAFSGGRACRSKTLERRRSSNRSHRKAQNRENRRCR
jgi:hypothetical protein